MEARFRNLIDEHGDRVYGLAVMLLAQRAEAEDVVQDALIKLWQQLPGLREGEEGSWLVACVRNACLDRLRTRARRSRLLRLVPERRPVVGPEDEASAGERKRRIREALRQLPEPGRSLLILRDMQGLDVATTARALELSPEQVKVYSHRARRRLRHAMEEVGDEQAA